MRCKTVIFVLASMLFVLFGFAEDAFSAWQPPIGIPTPSFGIDEVHTMYQAATYDFGGSIEAYRDAGNGPYTHYVDNTDGNATDSSNPYGTAAVPRLTIPLDLPAGSVVEVHGGPYTTGAGSIFVKGYGTLSNPIFVRGVSDPSAPYFEKKLRVEGTYLIVEELSAVGCAVMGEFGGARDTNRVSIRNNEFYRSDVNLAGDAILVGAYTENDVLRADNIVIYNNSVHDIGDINAAFDQDCGGLIVKSLTSGVWVVDNEIHTTSGTGVQVLADSSTTGLTAENIYIARNHIYNTRQSGVWAKYGRDIIFSENTVHGIVHTSWSPSKGMGFQYGPHNVWYLYNEVYDCVMGFYGPSTNTGDIYAYVIGNVIHDLTLPAGHVYNPDNSYEYSAIQWYGSAYRHIVGNTIDNVHGGINSGSSGGNGFTIEDNIISNVTLGKHIFIDYGAVADISTVENNLFYQPAGSVILELGSVVTGDMDDLRAQTSTGQGCVIADPVFVDSASDDFSLSGASSAIDIGSESSVYATFEGLYGIDIRKDISGTTRPSGSAWDIGAYEYDGPYFDPAIGDQTGFEGVNLNFTVNATDPGSDTITYGASGLPLGASFDVPTRTFDWTPGGTQAGSYDVTFTATAGGDTFSETITIAISSGSNTPPILAVIANEAGTEGLLIDFSASATDSDDDGLTFTLQGAVQGDAAIDPVTGYFTWNPTEAEGSSVPASYTVTVRVTDDGAGSLYDEQVVNITVGEVNSSPVIGAITDKSVAEDVELAFTASASDPVDIPANGLTFTLVSPPSGASITGGGAFTWTPTESQGPGSYSVTVKVTDDGSPALTDEATFNVTVNETNTAPSLVDPGAQTVEVNSLLEFTVTTNDTDVPANGLTYSLSNEPAGATIGSASGVFTWTPTGGYGTTYNVTIHVTDDGSPNLSDSIVVDITVKQDQTAPTITNLTPDDGLIGKMTNSMIVMSVTDTGTGVDPASVVIKLNTITIYAGDVKSYPSSIGTCRRKGNSAAYKYAFQADKDFTFDQDIVIEISAGDQVVNPAPNEFTDLRLDAEPMRIVPRAFGESKVLYSSGSNDCWGPISTVCDGNGDVWIAWPKGDPGDRDILLGKLSLEADSFENDVITTITNDAHDQGRLVLAVDSNDKIYMAWEDFRNSEWDIYVATSDDWTVHTRITDPNSNQINPAIAIDSSDEVYVVWEDDQNAAVGDEGKDIYVASSSDDFSTQVTVRVTSADHDQITPDIAIADNDNIYLIWADARTQGGVKYDLYGACNAPWTNSVMVVGSESQRNPKIDVEASSNNLHYVWLDEAPSGDDDIFYYTSDGLPGTPNDGSTVIDADDDDTDQFTPVIAVMGSGTDVQVFSCWRDERNGRAELYAEEIGSDGINIVVGDLLTMDDQSEPAIGIDKNDFPYLIWINGRTDICYSASTYEDPDETETGFIDSESVGTTTLGSTGSFSATFPAGAYEFDMDASVSLVRNPPIIYESGNTPLATHSMLYEFGPSDIVFTVPVTLTIPFSESELGNNPYPYWVDPDTDEISTVGISNVTVGNGVVTFQTTHFSEFGLGGGGGGGVFGGGGGGGCSMSRYGEGTIAEFLLPYFVLAIVLAGLKLRDRRKKKMSE